MAWVPMCGYVHWGAGVHGGQKGVSGSPELELQAVASRLSCVLGITLRTFGRAGFALNCSATSPTLARALGSSTPRSGFHDSAFPSRFPTLHFVWNVKRAGHTGYPFTLRPLPRPPQWPSCSTFHVWIAFILGSLPRGALFASPPHWKLDVLFSCLLGSVLPPPSPVSFVNFCIFYFGLFFIFIFGLCSSLLF